MLLSMLALTPFRRGKVMAGGRRISKPQCLCFRDLRRYELVIEDRQLRCGRFRLEVQEHGTSFWTSFIWEFPKIGVPFWGSLY